ncbi:MAG: hypothetical protein Q4E16_04585 [Neisseria sp.]|nr:hypothetical protein [Neisseria sp.]
MQNLNTQNEISLNSHSFNGMARLLEQLHNLARPQFGKLSDEQLQGLESDCNSMIFSLREAVLIMQNTRYYLENADVALSQKEMIDMLEVSQAFNEALYELSGIAQTFISTKSNRLSKQTQQLQTQLNLTHIKAQLRPHTAA